MSERRKWTRHGECGMVSEPYRVGKYFLDGCTLYGLWRDDAHLGYFECFEDAKVAAELDASAHGGVAS